MFGNKRLYSDQRTQVRHFYLDADYFLKHFVQRSFLSIYDECSGGNVSLFPPRIYYIIIMRREGKQPPLFFFFISQRAVTMNYILWHSEPGERFKGRCIQLYWLKLSEILNIVNSRFHCICTLCLYFHFPTTGLVQWRQVHSSVGTS